MQAGRRHARIGDVWVHCPSKPIQRPHDPSDDEDPIADDEVSEPCTDERVGPSSGGRLCMSYAANGLVMVYRSNHKFEANVTSSFDFCDWSNDYSETGGKEDATVAAPVVDAASNLSHNVSNRRSGARLVEKSSARAVVREDIRSLSVRGGPFPAHTGRKFELSPRISKCLKDPDKVDTSYIPNCGGVDLDQLAAEVAAGAPAAPALTLLLAAAAHRSGATTHLIKPSDIDRESTTASEDHLPEIQPSPRLPTRASGRAECTGSGAPLGGAGLQPELQAENTQISAIGKVSTQDIADSCASLRVTLSRSAVVPVIRPPKALLRDQVLSARALAGDRPCVREMTETIWREMSDSHQLSHSMI